MCAIIACIIVVTEPNSDDAVPAMRPCGSIAMALKFDDAAMNSALITHMKAV